MTPPLLSTELLAGLEPTFSAVVVPNASIDSRARVRLIVAGLSESGPGTGPNTECSATMGQHFA